MMKFLLFIFCFFIFIPSYSLRLSEDIDPEDGLHRFFLEHGTHLNHPSLNIPTSFFTLHALRPSINEDEHHINEHHSSFLEMLSEENDSFLERNMLIENNVNIKSSYRNIASSKEEPTNMILLKPSWKKFTMADIKEKLIDRYNFHLPVTSQPGLSFYGDYITLVKPELKKDNKFNFPLLKKIWSQLFLDKAINFVQLIFLKEEKPEGLIGGILGTSFFSNKYTDLIKKAKVIVKSMAITSSQFHHSLLNTATVHKNLGVTGKNVQICVVDNGVDKNNNGWTEKYDRRSSLDLVTTIPDRHEAKKKGWDIPGGLNYPFELSKNLETKDHKKTD